MICVKCGYRDEKEIAGRSCPRCRAAMIADSGDENTNVDDDHVSVDMDGAQSAVPSRLRPAPARVTATPVRRPAPAARAAVDPIVRPRTIAAPRRNDVHAESFLARRDNGSYRGGIFFLATTGAGLFFSAVLAILVVTGSHPAARPVKATPTPVAAVSATPNPVASATPVVVAATPSPTATPAAVAAKPAAKASSKAKASTKKPIARSRKTPHG